MRGREVTHTDRKRTWGIRERGQALIDRVSNNEEEENRCERHFQCELDSQVDLKDLFIDTAQEDVAKEEVEKEDVAKRRSLGENVEEVWEESGWEMVQEQRAKKVRVGIDRNDS